MIYGIHSIKFKDFTSRKMAGNNYWSSSVYPFQTNNADQTKENTQPEENSEEDEESDEEYEWKKRKDGSYLSYCASCRRRTEECPRCKREYEYSDSDEEILDSEEDSDSEDEPQRKSFGSKKIKWSKYSYDDDDIDGKEAGDDDSEEEEVSKQDGSSGEESTDEYK